MPTGHHLGHTERYIYCQVIVPFQYRVTRPGVEAKRRHNTRAPTPLFNEQVSEPSGEDLEVQKF